MLLAFSNQLYKTLMEAIRQCREKNLEITAELECCLRSADNCWNILRQKLMIYDFTSNTEEIHFFKSVKPKFTSEILYCRLVYEAERFCAEPIAPKDARKFWEWQLSRFEKFIDNKAVFYKYYKTGARIFDELWFLRSNGRLPQTPYYKQDARSATSHDHLVAEIIAMERYREFVCCRLLSFAGI